MTPFNVHNLPLNKKVLIEASAGTGKTYNIGLIVLRLILERKLEIEKIVLITFTEAATEELRRNTAERIQKAYLVWKEGEIDENADKEKDLIRIVKNAKYKKNGEIREDAQENEVNLSAALSRIDEMPVFTIHGFCNKILSEFPFETRNFEKRELVIDSRNIKRKVVADFWRKHIKNLDADIELKPKDLLSVVNLALKHPHAKISGEDYEASLEAYKSAGCEKDKKAAAKKLKFAIGRILAEDACRQAAAEKKKLKITDFDDMIKDCEKAVMNDVNNGRKLQNAIKNRYDAIFADEFQDTDKMQFRIFDYLFENKPFFMIGDPKQAIYRFRGGDIVAYKKSKEGVEKENRFSMSVNYRAQKNLLDALWRFFTFDTYGIEIFRSKMGKGIDYTSVECGKTELENIKLKDPLYPPFVIWRGEDNENKPVFEKKAQKAVVNEICRLLSTKNFAPQNIAVLLDTNEDCLAYKNALVKKGVYAIVKGGCVFESAAARFVAILLNAVCRGNNTACVRALLLHKFCGFEPCDIQGAAGEELFNEWMGAVSAAKTRWEKFGLMSAIDFFMEDRKLWGLIAELITGEREITNIRQILAILSEEEIKTGKIPEKINKRFAALLQEAARGDASEEKLESDDAALKIMTVHKSKGLEFDVVFVPDLSRSPREHNFPSAYEYNELDEKNIAFFAEGDKNMEILNNNEENEENARLLYVALTRAKYRLYAIFSPPKRKKDGNVSAAKGASSVCREIFDEFSELNDPNIAIQNLDELLEETDAAEKKELETESFERIARRFDFSVNPSWTRTSFSQIARNFPPFDFSAPAKKERPKIPAGARMGTLLHSIFESVDFKANDDEIKNAVKEKLSDFPEFREENGEENENIAEVKSWVSSVLNKKLPNSGAGKLKDAEQKISELAFLMNCKKFDLKKVQEKVAPQKINFDEPKVLNDEYISGAIDLVFLGADGKYYILDWKSNVMNGDFSAQNISAEMLGHGYHLQYYIYAVALKRQLEKTKENFDFTKEFGGVYYIFIRGVNEKNDDGIYFASGKETANSVILLDKILKGEE